MALSVEHFGRTYATATGTFTAVDDLSFTVASGEIVRLIGPNGAGKTTTLRSLAGILRPSAGRLMIDGHDLVADPLEAKRRLAFTPDEPHLFEYLTGAAHLQLTARRCRRHVRRARVARRSRRRRLEPGADFSPGDRSWTGRHVGHHVHREPLHHRLQRAKPDARAGAAVARAAVSRRRVRRRRIHLFQLL